MTTNHEHNGEDEQQSARLTAYALGQADTAELAEIEAQLAASPELREQVEQIRSLAGRVRESMVAGPTSRLRETVEKRLAEFDKAATTVPVTPLPTTRTKVRNRSWFARAIPYVAATMILAIMPTYLYLSRGNGRKVPVFLTANKPSSGATDELDQIAMKSVGNSVKSRNVIVSAQAQSSKKKDVVAFERRMVTQENQIMPNASAGADRPKLDENLPIPPDVKPGDGLSNGVGPVLIGGDDGRRAGRGEGRAVLGYEKPTATPQPGPAVPYAGEKSDDSGIFEHKGGGTVSDDVGPLESAHRPSHMNGQENHSSQGAGWGEGPGSGDGSGQLAQGQGSGSGSGDAKSAGDRSGSLSISTLAAPDETSTGKDYSVAELYRSAKAADGSRSAQAGGMGGGANSDSKPDEDATWNHKRYIHNPTQTWQPSRVTSNTSRLMVGDHDELPLKGMQVDVRIDGFRARVVLDLYYYNNRPQQLEGNFQLRLPDEASPYFVAFGRTVYQAPQITAQDSMFFKREQVSLGDTTPEKILEMRSHSWEQPKVARMVPKEKAASAYRESVRRRVDPALVEWSGAGVFQCRVYPLAPQSLHRVSIGYDVDLLAVGDDLELKLDLPNNTPACIVDVNIAGHEPKQVSLDAVATPSADGQRLTYRLVDPQQRPLSVRLHKPGTAMLTGADEGSEGRTGRYFAARVSPALPAVPASEGSRNAVFLVDTSASAGPQFPLWTKLLKATLDNNRDRIDRFAVLFFNVETFWWQEKYVANTPENVEALMQYANGLVLEGATDLGRALQEAARFNVSGTLRVPLDNGTRSVPDTLPPDTFLLSDGASTWGEDRWPLLARTLGTGPLYAYRTGMTGTDMRMLSLLAEKTGGAVFSVVGEAEIAQASVAYRARPWRIAGVEVQGGRDVLLAGRPQYVFPGQQLLVVGRLEAGADSGREVALALKQGKATQTIKMTLDRTIDSELAARTYGQVATGQLEELPAENESLATAYARHFRITGRTCSLLMLETEQDYARYNIKPEEDSFVVKERPAGAVVAKAAESGASLVDAKALFMAWFNHLNNDASSGGGPNEGRVHFDLPAALGLALENLPSESFEVAGPSLRCKVRERQELPVAFREPWFTGLPDYEAFSAEADRRLQAGNTDDAVRAISTLVEERPGDVALMRDVAFSTIAWDRPAEAYHLLRRAAAARTFEPVTLQALAHCMEQLGNSDMAVVYYELLCAGQWDNRFGDVHNIAQLDYLRFLRRTTSGKPGHLAGYAESRLATLSKMQLRDTADLAAMILWNTDGTDVDLHVIEPSGEECFYQHTQTASGGHISRDVTTGYGPELYLLPQAPSGTYRVNAHYFATDANRTSTRTKVLAFIYQGWGTTDEKVSVKALALVGHSESHEIGTVKR